jgi:HD-GYP domain-containing protein (c-di-GMP phosphodiesterase class II)
VSLELCEMSLQQLRSLLQLTDNTLQNICCRHFTTDELFVEALRKVLGGLGRRGPGSIFTVFWREEGSICRGTVFQLRQGEVVHRSDEIEIDPASNYAVNLAITKHQEETIVSNWTDTCESIDDYQANFLPSVTAAVGIPIKNFITCRISGEKPGSLIAFNYPGKATDYDADVLHGLAVLLGSVVALSDTIRETENAFLYTIEALARACEAAEEGTGKHIARVNRYAGALAANAGVSTELVRAISFSAQMHDVGKIKVPNTVLLKEGPLDSRELELVMMHPIYGERILGNSPRLQVAREIAISHHENWDGSGYPYKLRGHTIPMAGRVVKIADVYDAVRSQRSYKEPLSHREAVEIFRNGDERIDPQAHFDPALLQTFFNIEHIFEKIYESLAGEEVSVEP